MYITFRASDAQLSPLTLLRPLFQTNQFGYCILRLAVCVFTTSVSSCWICFDFLQSVAYAHLKLLDFTWLGFSFCPQMLDGLFSFLQQLLNLLQSRVQAGYFLLGFLQFLLNAHLIRHRTKLFSDLFFCCCCFCLFVFPDNFEHLLWLQEWRTQIYVKDVCLDRKEHLSRRVKRTTSDSSTP